MLLGAGVGLVGLITFMDATFDNWRYFRGATTESLLAWWLRLGSVVVAGVLLVVLGGWS